MKLEGNVMKQIKQWLNLGKLIEHLIMQNIRTKTDGTKYDFNRFALPLKFAEKIFDYKITLDKAIEDQRKLKILTKKLNNDYTPRITKNMNEKNKVLESARKLSDARDEIINLVEKGISPYKDNAFKPKEEDESEEKSEKERLKNLSNMLRMNQRVLTIICLKTVLILSTQCFGKKII